MASTTDREQLEVPQPPQAPEVERRLHVHPLQLFGVPVILMVPLLALLGVFGETTSVTSASSPSITMEVEYPTRFRYKTIDTIDITVHNVSGTEVELQVRVPKSYLDAFSNVAVTPQPTRVTSEHYIVELGGVQPDATRVVSIEVQAERYGPTSGLISAGPGDEPAEARIETFVFP